MLVISSRLVALAAVTLLTSSVGHAASQRAFVSAGGIDNPNCSLAAPCRSFAAAIAAIVSGGEVIVLDSAGYGPVTITKFASIITPPGVYAGVSVLSGTGITVNGPGVSVVLRGLTINGLDGDHGIFIHDAERVRIEHCVVSGMSHMGIFHQANGGKVVVSDTIVRDNAEDGIRMVASSGSITLERVNTEGNVNSGFYVSPNAASGKLDATISDSLFARNGKYGIWADAGASAFVYATIDRSTLADNGIHGMLALGSTSAVLRVAVQRSTLRGNSPGAGIVAQGDSPSTIDVNASDNLLHLNASWGLIAVGSGATITASGNNHDGMGCSAGGTIVTYHNNSVQGAALGCWGPASLL